MDNRKLRQIDEGDEKIETQKLIKKLTEESEWQQPGMEYNEVFETLLKYYLTGEYDIREDVIKKLELYNPFYFQRYGEFDAVYQEIRDEEMPEVEHSVKQQNVKQPNVKQPVKHSVKQPEVKGTRQKGTRSKSVKQNVKPKGTRAKSTKVKSKNTKQKPKHRKLKGAAQPQLIPLVPPAQLIPHSITQSETTVPLSQPNYVITQLYPSLLNNKFTIKCTLDQIRQQNNRTVLYNSLYNITNVSKVFQNNISIRPGAPLVETQQDIFTFCQAEQWQTRIINEKYTNDIKIALYYDDHHILQCESSFTQIQIDQMKDPKVIFDKDTISFFRYLHELQIVQFKPLTNINQQMSLVQFMQLNQVPQTLHLAIQDQLSKWGRITDATSIIEGIRIQNLFGQLYKQNIQIQDVRQNDNRRNDKRWKDKRRNDNQRNDGRRNDGRRDDNRRNDNQRWKDKRRNDDRRNDNQRNDNRRDVHNQINRPAYRGDELSGDELSDHSSYKDIDTAISDFSDYDKEKELI